LISGPEKSPNFIQILSFQIPPIGRWVKVWGGNPQLSCWHPGDYPMVGVDEVSFEKARLNCLSGKYGSMPKP